MSFKFNPFTGDFDYYENSFKGVLSSEPSSPSNGWFYINSTNNTLYVYYAGIWQALHVLSTPTIQTGNPIGLLLGLTYQL